MKVYFIGAGPGDPDLITVKGLRVLNACPVVIYAGSLVPRELVDQAASAEVIHDSASLDLNEIIELIQQAEAKGQDVARVHSGDPSVYGAIGEQMRKLDELSIEYEIIPGVTAVSASAAMLKKELTLSQVSQTVIYTRYAGKTPMPNQESLSELARSGATLAIHLGITRIHKIVEELIPFYGEDCPVAVCYRTSWPEQDSVQGTLSDITAKVRDKGFTRTALILVGHVLDAEAFGDSYLYDADQAHVYRPKFKPAQKRTAKRNIQLDSVLGEKMPNDSQKQALRKVPATIVTGFLGSGKTTLLSNILRQANGQRIAVIVNEFGALDIDAELIRSCPLDCEDEAPVDSDNGIYELANGCICCTVEEEFLPVMKQLVERKDDIDHILIETSGLALPKPLVQAFGWPDIKQHCTVDSVITLVDGPATADGRFADDPDTVETLRQADENLDHDPSLQELLDDQLSAADLVVITKTDQLDASAMSRVKELIASRVPQAVKQIEIENGQIDYRLVTGIEAASEERINEVHTHHDHHHDHGHHHKHAHDDFESISMKLGEVNSDQLMATLSELLAKQPIMRAKGFAAIEGKPMRQVIQAVGQRIDTYFDQLWQNDEPREGRLVFIGKGIDRSQIQSALDALTA